MKRTLLLLAGCLAPAVLATDAAAQSKIARPVAVVQDQQQDDVATLRRAARILRSKGHNDEAKRLLKIANELKAKPKKEAKAKKKAKPKKEAKPKKDTKAKDKANAARRAEARARKILKGDFQEKAVRVKALELVADCYKRAGDIPNAEAMAWFAALGKSQVEGGEMSPDPIPEAVQARDGNVQGRLTEIIRMGEPIQLKMGNKSAARVHSTLADYYERRSRGEDPAAAEPAPPTRERDLTYIEGRLPALRIAERAYGLDVRMTPEARESGAKRMAWMVALARLRVEGEGVEVPPVPGPGPVNMEALIDTIRSAGELHAKAGDRRAARRCFDLAEYYKLREAGEVADNSRTTRIAGLGYVGADEEEPDVDREEEMRRRALEERRMDLEARIIEVQKRLAEAKAELEALRRKNRR